MAQSGNELSTLAQKTQSVAASPAAAPAVVSLAPKATPAASAAAVSAAVAASVTPLFHIQGPREIAIILRKDEIEAMRKESKDGNVTVGFGPSNNLRANLSLRLNLSFAKEVKSDPRKRTVLYANGRDSAMAAPAFHSALHLQSVVARTNANPDFPDTICLNLTFGDGQAVHNNILQLGHRFNIQAGDRLWRDSDITTAFVNGTEGLFSPDELNGLNPARPGAGDPSKSLYAALSAAISPDQRQKAATAEITALSNKAFEIKGEALPAKDCTFKQSDIMNLLKQLGNKDEARRPATEITAAEIERLSLKLPFPTARKVEAFVNNSEAKTMRAIEKIFREHARFKSSPIAKEAKVVSQFLELDAQLGGWQHFQDFINLGEEGYKDRGYDFDDVKDAKKQDEKKEGEQLPDLVPGLERSDEIAPLRARSKALYEKLIMRVVWLLALRNQAGDNVGPGLVAHAMVAYIATDVAWLNEAQQLMKDGEKAANGMLKRHAEAYKQFRALPVAFPHGPAVRAALDRAGLHFRPMPIKRDRVVCDDERGHCDVETGNIRPWHNLFDFHDYGRHTPGVLNFMQKNFA